MYMVEDELGAPLSKVLSTRELALGAGVHELWKSGAPVWVVGLVSGSIEIIRPVRDGRGDLVGMILENDAALPLVPSLPPMGRTEPKPWASYLRVIK